MENRDKNLEELYNLLGPESNDENPQQPHPANRMDIQIQPTDTIELEQQHRSQLSQHSQRTNPRALQMSTITPIRPERRQAPAALLHQHLHQPERHSPVRQQDMQEELNELEKILSPPAAPSQETQPEAALILRQCSVSRRLTIPAYHDWYSRNYNPQNKHSEVAPHHEHDLNLAESLDNQQIIMQRTTAIQHPPRASDQPRASAKLRTAEEPLYAGQYNSTFLPLFASRNPVNNRGTFRPSHGATKQYFNGQNVPEMQQRKATQGNLVFRSNISARRRRVPELITPRLGSNKGNTMAGKRVADSIELNPTTKKPRAERIIPRSQTTNRRKLAFERGDPSMAGGTTPKTRFPITMDRKSPGSSIIPGKQVLDDAVNLVNEIVDIPREQNELMKALEIGPENSPEDSSRLFLEGRALRETTQKNMEKHGIQGEVPKEIAELISHACRERVGYLLDNASGMAKVRVSSAEMGEFVTRDKKNDVPKVLEKMKEEEEIGLIAASNKRTYKWRKQLKEQSARERTHNKTQERVTRAEKKKKLKAADMEEKKLRSQNSALSAVISGIVMKGKKNKTILPPLQLPGRLPGPNSEIPRESMSTKTAHKIGKGSAGQRNSDGETTIRIEDILAVCASEPRMQYSDLVYEWCARGNGSEPPSQL